MKLIVYDFDPQESSRTYRRRYRRAERFKILIMCRLWGWVHHQVSGLSSVAKSDSKRSVAMNTTATRKSLANVVYESGSNISKTAVILSFNRPCMESCSASADTNRDVYMYLYILPVGPHLEGERRISALLFPLLHSAHVRTSSAFAALRIIVLRLRHHFGSTHGSLPLILRLVGQLRLRHRESRTDICKDVTCAGTRLVVCGDGVDVAYFSKSI
jgi:hypothetical protein